MHSRKSKGFAIRGFTLIELLVVIVIIGILVAIALPNFVRIKEKAKEAEVKQNLHSIQLAVERYAVDNPYGNYPNYILGGDWTDTATINEDYYYYAQLDQVEYPPWKGSGPEFAPDGEGDYLIMEGYMAVYPKNPFIKTGQISNLRRLHHKPVWQAVDFPRVVGGSENHSMVEIFGPPPAWIFMQKGIGGDLYVIPPYPDFNTGQGFWENDNGYKDVWSNPDRRRTRGSKLLSGNFSYFSRVNINGWLLFNGAHEVNGYTLAGYGTLSNLGHDVYDRNANYFPSYRTATCPLRSAFGGGAWLQCPSAGEPNNAQASVGGPDGLPDGVIIVLDSGVDKKSLNVTGEIEYGQG